MQVSSRNLLLKAHIFAAHLASVTANTPGDGPQAPTFPGHSYLSDLIFSPSLPPFSRHTTSHLSPACRGPLPLVPRASFSLSDTLSRPLTRPVLHHPLRSFTTPWGPSPPPGVLHHPLGSSPSCLLLSEVYPAATPAHPLAPPPCPPIPRSTFPALFFSLALTTF